MIIGISGKIGSGKDTVGNIIQYLTTNNNIIKNEPFYGTYQAYSFHLVKGGFRGNKFSEFKIKKFADKLKDIVCLLINCTREQLEDEVFKNTELGEEWTNYSYANGFWSHSDDNPSHKMMDSVQCSKEKYEQERIINWQTAYKRLLIPRLLLQLIGTECGRNIIHLDIWVNSLMSEYNINYNSYAREIVRDSYPDWIITDVRFPNELKAIKNKKGISIRINRPKPECTCSVLSAENCMKNCDKSFKFEEHESERALDNAEFDYMIYNTGTIEDLIEDVKGILIQEKIINN